jgi:signal transduction histidine kinase
MQLQTALKQANQELEQRVQERTYELRKTLDRLTELTQVKANFIANISHELRTPLTLIKGYLDFMSDGGFGTITPEQGEAIGAMARAEGRLEKLIEDLIEYSGAERGQLKLEMSSVQLGELVRLTILHAMQKIQAAQVNLSITLPQDLPAVRCDPGKISLVITELFNNAIKFTPKDGRVIVEAYPEKDVVTLAITDTGIGIPVEGLQEIFEPFHQLDGSSTRRYGGTGLGLALSNRIIETHGSRIRVQSEPGKGSRFEFSLPMDQRAWGQE